MHVQYLPAGVQEGMRSRESDRERETESSGGQKWKGVFSVVSLAASLIDFKIYLEPYLMTIMSVSVLVNTSFPPAQGKIHFYRLI